MKPPTGKIQTMPVARVGRQGIVKGGTQIDLLHPSKMKSFTERPGHLTQR